MREEYILIFFLIRNIGEYLIAVCVKQRNRNIHFSNHISRFGEGKNFFTPCLLRKVWQAPGSTGPDARSLYADLVGGSFCIHLVCVAVHNVYIVTLSFIIVLEQYMLMITKYHFVRRLMRANIY